MNKVVTFLLGAVAGSVATYLILKEKHEQLLQDEVDALRDYYEAKGEKSGLYLAEETEPELSEETPEAEMTEEEAKKEVKALVRQKREYNRKVKPYGGEPKTYESQPYVITVEEFSEQRPEFEKLTIYYYLNDSTLADEKEEIIPDINSIISPDVISYFHRDPDEPGVVYVRNEKMGTDYEVIGLAKSYSEDVLGKE